MAAGSRVRGHRVEGVLGTRLDVVVDGSQRLLRSVVATVLQSIDRSEGIFSVYRADSELSRLRQQPAGTTPYRLSPELGAVLRNAARWHRVSGGAFSPNTAHLTTRWRVAAADDQLPSSTEMAALAARHLPLPYRFDNGPDRELDRDDTIIVVDDCAGLDLNAIAKGTIVDTAFDAALTLHRPHRVTVNLGGDLRHWSENGSCPLDVGIEDPNSRAANRAPVATVTLNNQALATSGHQWRGVRVGANWYSHIIDPRTGWPCTSYPSVTAIAPTAQLADIAATIASVADPSELTTASLAGSLTDNDIDIVTVDADGAVHHPLG